MTEKTQLPAQSNSFAGQVWQTLSEVDVSDLTEEKGKMTYLSWANSWAVLMEIYPESNYRLMENEYFHDGTVSVAVEVTVKQGEDSLTRTMFLQVLDNKMRAMEHPNSHMINNARMRCLTKCIALFGLAGYLYQGQDVPSAADIEVVAKIPRIPHEEFLANVKQKMDECTTVGTLKVQARGGCDYFKKWGELEHYNTIKEHYTAIEATFLKGEELAAEKKKQAALEQQEAA